MRAWMKFLPQCPACALGGQWTIDGIHCEGCGAEVSKTKIQNGWNYRRSCHFQIWVWWQFNAAPCIWVSEQTRWYLVNVLNYFPDRLESGPASYWGGQCS